jgi:hypothetical protein
MDRIVREAIEIELQPNNIKRDAGFVSERKGSLSFAPSINFQNMTPDLLGYVGHA